MGIYITMIIAVLFIVALPVIYFGGIDGTTALVLGAGTGLIIWIIFRSRSLRK